MVHLIRAQIADAVVTHAEPTTHAELIRLLARPGHALHPQSRCHAGLFALEVYRAARRGFDRTAVLVAAAVELYGQSGHLFDELSDRVPDRAAVELPLALALLVAATGTAADASADSSDPAGTLRHFCDATGALRTTRLKSGSLGTFAAGFAARAAGAEPAAAVLFERLGFNLFTFAQLADDRSGASDFASVLALTSLGRAHADLQLLAARGYAIGPLECLVARVEADAQSAPGRRGRAGRAGTGFGRDA